LDEPAVRAIYGTADHALDESITSTSIAISGALPAFARA
jgi:hypothetical protein